MAIQPMCDACKTELSEFGAILLSPPSEDSKVMKYHICTGCYEHLTQALNL